MAKAQICSDLLSLPYPVSVAALRIHQSHRRMTLRNAISHSSIDNKIPVPSGTYAKTRCPLMAVAKQPPTVLEAMRSLWARRKTIAAGCTVLAVSRPLYAKGRSFIWRSWGWEKATRLPVTHDCAQLRTVDPESSYACRGRSNSR